MGDSPSQPAAPEPPDYAQANREGVVADVETLPVRRMVEQMARLGKSGRVYVPGGGMEGVPVDFTGLSDADLTRAMIPAERDAAIARAEYVRDIQKEISPDMVKNQRELVRLSDPKRFELFEEYIDTVADDVQRGGRLDPSVQREVEQSVRRGQTARGNVLGAAPAAAEAMTVGRESEARKARAYAAAQSLLGLSPVSAQFGSMNQATGPAPINPSLYQGVNLNPNAGQQGAQFAMQSYGTQAQVWQTQAQLAQQQAQMNNPLNMAGQVVGLAGNVAGLGMGMARMF